MALPKVVEEQAKKAEEMAKQLLGQDPSVAVPPAGNTPQAPQVMQTTTQPQVVSEPQGEPQPVSGQAEPQPPGIPEQPLSCPECAKWEQRYRVLQGKYDAEVPRLTYRVAFLENQIDELKRAGQAQLQSQPAQAGQAVRMASVADALRNSEDEKLKSFRENFPDIFEFVTTAIDQVASQTQKAVEEKLSSIEKVSVKTLEDRFWSAIEKEVPDWRVICQDNSHLWANWLLQKDRYSPRTRLDLLKEAQASFDAPAVINMLNDFKKEMGMGVGSPAASPNINQTQSPAPPKPAAPVITPPSGPSVAPSASVGQVEYIPRSYISQFYQDKARGRFYGREKLMQEIEAKINKAVMEGRVIEG